MKYNGNKSQIKKNLLYETLKEKNEKSSTFI